jgi:hypothetical protein
VVNEPVAHAGFMYIPRLGIIYFKRLITVVAIGFVSKIMMDGRNIVHKPQGKHRYVFPLSLAPQKFPPGNKQIFHGYDIIIDMAKPYSLSLDNASILQRIKEAYLIWIDISRHIPKNARYTLSSRIENKFLDLLDLALEAYFIKKESVFLKTEKVDRCIFISDTIKFLLAVTWEGKLVSSHHVENVSKKMEEVGRMLWGWKNGLEKKTPVR